MKKIFFSLVVLICCMSMNAQIMKVVKGTEVVATYKGADYQVVFEEQVPVTSITLNTATVGLSIGGDASLATTTLTATVAPENATDQTITWSSDNVEVATVSAEGVVTAVGVGTTTIKATANDGSEVVGSCTVTVSEFDDGQEHYTLDQINAMDCYIYSAGGGGYYCDCDLYVSDIENNTYSKNLDVYVPLLIMSKDKIAGNHDMAIDAKYYEYYGYTTNEGDYSAFTQGTMNVSYKSQGVDEYGDDVYFYDIVIAAKLQNGQDFDLTVNNCRVYATDPETMEYIPLLDGNAKASSLMNRVLSKIKTNKKMSQRGSRAKVQ